MGTIVSIEVVHPHADAAIERAFAWFREIEARCTRFNQSSELMQLVAQPGVPIPASRILFEAVRFSLIVAEATEGAFDPTTAGHFKDLVLDPEQNTITLNRQITLDLGAVAKGLAVDAAARELEPFEHFAIDAGGDLYLGGLNPNAEPWTVGIRHPRRDREVVHTLRVSNQAVCTSGDYERGHHIQDPRTGKPAHSVASATVIAPSAMLADALATAAFVLGPDEGILLLHRMGVEGLIFTPDLHLSETRGLPRVA